MRSARWPSACDFCARGVPDFRNFANFSRKFLRRICVSSTLDPRIILHENSHRLGIELQRSSEVCETTLAEFTQLLCARRAKIFRDLGNFFARVGRKICVTPTLDACFFGFECISGSFIQRTATLCSMRSARWPNARNFCARGVPDIAEKNDIPKKTKKRLKRKKRWVADRFFLLDVIVSFVQKKNNHI